jgi:hypothetical protein
MAEFLGAPDQAVLDREKACTFICTASPVFLQTFTTCRLATFEPLAITVSSVTDLLCTTSFSTSTRTWSMKPARSISLPSAIWR